MESTRVAQGTVDQDLEEAARDIVPACNTMDVSIKGSNSSTMSGHQNLEKVASLADSTNEAVSLSGTTGSAIMTSTLTLSNTAAPFSQMASGGGAMRTASHPPALVEYEDSIGSSDGSLSGTETAKQQTAITLTQLEVKGVDSMESSDLLPDSMSPQHVGSPNLVIDTGEGTKIEANPVISNDSRASTHTNSEMSKASGNRTTAHQLQKNLQNSEQLNSQEQADIDERTIDLDACIDESDMSSEEEEETETKTTNTSLNTLTLYNQPSMTFSSGATQAAGAHNSQQHNTQATGSNHPRSYTILKINSAPSTSLVPNGGPCGSSSKALNSRQQLKGGYPEGVVGGEGSNQLRVRQVSKMKQFFTTLQTFGNKMSAEVAEQVQELITALVNGTASIEEFHQEIQTVTNYPLKELIIPFLRENLGYFRQELKDSSQALSDILGDSAAPSTSVGLTPQLVDDELPMLSNSKSGQAVRTVTSITSSVSSSQPHNTAAGTSRSVNTQTAAAAAQQHGTGIGAHAKAHSHVDLTDRMESGHSTSSSSMIGKKRANRLSNDRISMDKDVQTSYLAHPATKRPHTSSIVSESTVITSSTSSASAAAHRHPSSHPHTLHHPHTGTDVVPHPPVAAAAATGGGGGGVMSSRGAGFVTLEHLRKRSQATSEDWGHVETMLTSIMGMIDRTRQAVAALKERVVATQAEMDRREHDLEGVIQQRLADAMDKMKRQAAEDKQNLMQEAGKQMRDAVATVRADMESHIAQAQAMGVKEALKESNFQSSSKENCWNCGRRATETCSGCNKARYCGTFCQHKDWSNHMHHCASTTSTSSTTASQPGRATPTITVTPQAATAVVGATEMIQLAPTQTIPHNAVGITVKTEQT